MFKIRIIFLVVSRIYKKNAVPELIKLSQIVNDTWETIYWEAQFCYLQKDNEDSFVRKRVSSCSNALPCPLHHSVERFVDR